MIKKIYEYKYRIINVVVALICFFCAYGSINYIFGGKELTNFDYFSYYGTVITIVSFLVALFEILHSTSHTLSASQRIKSEVDKLIHTNYISNKSYILKVLDGINDSIIGWQYSLALERFRIARRHIAEDVILSESCQSVVLEFGSVEQHLLSYIAYDAKEDMPVRFKKLIQRVVLDLKREIERNSQ